MYVPNESEYYTVKQGVTQAPFQIGNRKMITRSNEDKTRFYIIATEEIEIGFPKVTVVDGDGKLNPAVNLVGYSNIDGKFNGMDDDERIQLFPRGDATIMELTYNCIEEGSFPLVVSIAIKDTSISFSWTKVLLINNFRNVEHHV